MKAGKEGILAEKKAKSLPWLEVPCLYFRESGEETTRRTLERGAQRAQELDVRSVVAASTSGRTGLLAVPLFKGRNLRPNLLRPSSDGNFGQAPAGVIPANAWPGA